MGLLRSSSQHVSTVKNTTEEPATQHQETLHPEVDEKNNNTLNHLSKQLNTDHTTPKLFSHCMLSPDLKPLLCVLDCILSSSSVRISLAQWTACHLHTQRKRYAGTSTGRTHAERTRLTLTLALHAVVHAGKQKMLIFWEVAVMMRDANSNTLTERLPISPGTLWLHGGPEGWRGLRQVRSFSGHCLVYWIEKNPRLCVRVCVCAHGEAFAIQMNANHKRFVTASVQARLYSQRREILCFSFPPTQQIIDPAIEKCWILSTTGVQLAQLDTAL